MKMSDLPPIRNKTNSKIIHSLSRPASESTNRLPNENVLSAVPSDTSQSKKSSRSKHKVDLLQQLQEPLHLIASVELAPPESPTEGNWYCRRDLVCEFFGDLLANIVDTREMLPPPENSGSSDESLPQKPNEEERPSFEQSMGMSSVDFVSAVKSGSRYTVESINEEDKSSSSFIQTATYTRREMIAFKNGNVYIGEVSQGTMQGEGTYTWVDGTVYEGLFEDGLPTGRGIMTLPDRSRYEGQFLNGYFHGKGSYNLSDTAMFYKGEWKSGYMHGDGWLQDGNQRSYEGEWHKGLRQGHGFRIYSNGARYLGEWFKNKKSGVGRMVYANHDYYFGSWENDLPHGFGEYFWDIFFNETFTFPLYNYYKGTWEQGLRNGVGIMFFGMSNGLKLAGTWKNNIKHGPGIMVCGNGVLLQKSPLFRFDKPAHKACISKTSDNANVNSTSDRTTHSFYDILNIIDSRKPIKEFPEELVNGLNSYMHFTEPKYVKFVDPSEHVTKKKIQLLKIMTGPPTELDLSYFLDQFLDTHPTISNSQLKSEDIGASKVRFDNPLQESTETPSDNLIDIRNIEEQILRNAITIYLPQLTQLYHKYATIACEIPVNFKPTLVRLFLWQLYRDAQVMDVLPLVDIDEFLWNNPNSCYETKHNPFEPIYFWQFIQALVGCASLSYLGTDYKNSEPKKGWIAKIFTTFIDNMLLSSEIYSGQALKTHKNMVSFEAMYNLYASIGEPHSVKQFLANAYVKRGAEPPCYVAFNRSNNVKNLVIGRNAVMVGNILTYLKDGKTIVGDATDKYANTLYALRSIGKKKIVSNFMKICPRIDPGTSNLDLTYKITFLEFLEVVILCVFEKATGNKLKNEAELKKLALEKMLQNSVDKPSIYSGCTLPRISRIFKKKKTKKSVV